MGYSINHTIGIIWNQ